MSEAAQKVAEFIELASPEGKPAAVCERVALHYERGETVAVWCPDPQEAADLDGMLWTFRQNAFIPHVCREQAEEPLIEPVVIFADSPGGFEADVLIVAAADEALPAWCGRFAHVYDFAEVYDEGRRRAGRARYAALKDAGYRMRFIKS